jgi:BASS family bile acid:Na+ symporter
MTIATLISIAIKISLMLLVLGLGLRASIYDTLFVFRRPGHLLRAFVAMDIAVPLVALALTVGSGLDAPVKIALVTLSLAPLPATFSKKPLKAGGKVPYAVGLFVAITLISVLFIPLALSLLARLTGLPLQMTGANIWALVVWSLLAPLVAGLVIHQVAPAFADRAADPVAKAGSILLLLAAVPILIRVWPVMITLVGNGTLVAMIVLAVLAVATGHLLGGPDRDDRSTLALASAGRHPAIAIAIAKTNFPDEKFAPAAVLLYLIVCAVITVPYLRRVTRYRSVSAGGIASSAGLMRP